MKNYSVCGAVFLLIGFIHVISVRAAPFPTNRRPVADSVGIEKTDGKRYILHRVDEGQTLYAVARRYGRSVAEIRAANPDMSDALRYDQVIRIPIPDGALSKKEEKKIDKAIKKQEKEEKKQAATENDTKKSNDPAKAGIHVVEAGQTLYSLASRYGVSQSDLRKWNNLSGDNVMIGQALIVSEKAYQDRNPSSPADAGIPARPASPAPARPTETHSNEPKTVPPSTPKPTETHSNESKTSLPADPKPTRRNEQGPGTDETVSKNASSTTTPKPAEPEVELPSPGNDAPMPTRGRRISSSGVAEMIEGSGSGKYLALHRSAPIGTLVQVRNEFNNQSMWVKVIGRLPDTGVNDKILIKLSTQAFTKLSPEDRRFRAEVSYISR
ncbi:LysM peptidoglycan-binding domain-containing protein [Spirosoma spitsbergense]|uniref:LysM peptidoglycan-binding domain-containing protein n=1 Tax=Spirosoma spitsbergense TaxID=431554 RepID=UPI0003796E7E|nr:LysM peptidoglycan-binding domain-containing protein [Spirosoma spitsbergense]